MASWRSFSTFTALAYSGLSAVRSGRGKSSTFFGTARSSRGGAELRTEVRPVLATFICVPAALANVPRAQACFASSPPNLRNSVPDSPFHSTDVT
ncbi:hypothetical protein Y717_15030 [Streptomyces scopuliridis RB72]|uniref:Uncharacterized protein n=1 Tax=Streptomyces scopuliridis RB72 TaxID=1440053 RepID=A0A2T7T4X3_9ACTN|nr:hypothetical protein Y717_15030 [Streptomyces scopuliridis RB72]